MLSTDALFLFIFIFSCLVLIKNVIKLIGTLLGRDINFSGRDLLFFGLSLSAMAGHRFGFSVLLICRVGSSLPIGCSKKRKESGTGLPHSKESQPRSVVIRGQAPRTSHSETWISVRSVLAATSPAFAGQHSFV